MVSLNLFFTCLSNLIRSLIWNVKKPLRFSCWSFCFVFRNRKIQIKVILFLFGNLNIKKMLSSKNFFFFVTQLFLKVKSVCYRFIYIFCSLSSMQIQGTLLLNIQCFGQKFTSIVVWSLNKNFGQQILQQIFLILLKDSIIFSKRPSKQHCFQFSYFTVYTSYIKMYKI